MDRAFITYDELWKINDFSYFSISLVNVVKQMTCGVMVLLLLGIVNGCTGIVCGDPGTNATPAVSIDNGVQYELIGRYDVDRLNTILTTELANFTPSPITYPEAGNAVKLYRVSYPSVIPEKGNKTTIAYGLVAIPDTGNKEMPMVCYEHGTVYGQYEVPSYPEQSMETRLMIANFAGQGYILIAPDYFGMGSSTEKEGYVVKASMQQASLDMYYAAMAVLAHENISVTDKFVTGWSEGGFGAMAFLEKLEQVGIPIRAVSTASAPVDGIGLVNRILYEPREIDADWLTTMVILSAFSFEDYYNDPGLTRALFNPDQYEVAQKIYLKETVNESDFPTDFKKLIRPEYFDPRYLEASNYGRHLKDAETYRWLIQTPVRNYYGEADELLTIGQGQLPMFYQQGMGNDKVQAFSAGQTATHRGTFVYSIAEQKKWFDSLLTDT